MARACFLQLDFLQRGGIQLMIKRTRECSRTFSFEFADFFAVCRYATPLVAFLIHFSIVMQRKLVFNSVIYRTLESTQNGNHIMLPKNMNTF